MKTDLSQKLFEKANTLFPGGVNSPVRAFKGVGGTPRFIARGKGSRMWDVDGNATSTTSARGGRSSSATATRR